MIHGIHHTAISSSNIERSLAFYRDLLGFKEVFNFDWKVGTKKLDDNTGLSDSSARVVMLKAGNACIELFEFETPSPKSVTEKRPVCDHGITHLCLQVSDIDSEYNRLREAGMEFHCAPQSVGDSLRATYGRDPDGNVVELLEETVASEMSIISA